MRSLNSLRNLIVSLLYELLVVAFGLFVPRLIIGTYGNDVNGLSSTVNQVLQIMNLLSAGAAGASIYQMYRPVAENDYEKVSMIMDGSRKYFFKLGLVFVGLVLCFSPVFGFLMGSENISVIEKIIAFLILGANGALYFFFTSWYDILFSSHQKRFILSIAQIIDKVVYYSLVIVIIVLKLNYMWMYVAMVGGTSLRICVLYAVYCKTYKPLMKKIPKDSYFKIPDRGHLLVNQLSLHLVSSVPTVAVSLICGLRYASIFSLYMLVLNMIKMILNTMQCSVSEVFGNLIVSKDGEEVKKVFSTYDYIFTVAGVILCVCAAVLYMPFMNVYTAHNTLKPSGSTESINYLFPMLALLIVLVETSYSRLMPYNTVTVSYGMFKETYKQSLICGIIAAALSVGLTFIDWYLVMIGPLFYYFSTLVYRMYISKRRLDWLNLYPSVRRSVFQFVAVAAGFFLSQLIFGADGYVKNWWYWLLYACITGAIVVVLIAIYTAIFERKEFKSSVGYIKAILFRKRKKQNA